RELAKEDLMAGVKGGMGAVMGCVSTATVDRELKPGEHTLVLEWNIQPDGSVADPHMVGPNYLMATSMPDCFARGMLNWRFAASAAGAPVRNFPFGPFTIKD
ncbi:hypothetical protein ACFL6C_11585, partial [Myxococcota bacterium]